MLETYVLVGVLLHKQIRHHKISQAKKKLETYTMSQIKAEFSKTVLKYRNFKHYLGLPHWLIKKTRSFS